MALRGPQQHPDSKRGKVANRDGIPEPIQESLDAPDWLEGLAVSEFWRLVELNRGAGVSIRRVDADQYADLAGCTLRARNTQDPELYLKFAKQVNELRSQLNMGPRNRRRVGIVDSQKPNAVNPMAALIRMPSASGE